MAVAAMMMPIAVSILKDAKVNIVGKGGADEFLVRTYISGKPDIVARHVGDDDVVNWNGVAGENEYGANPKEGADV